MNLKWWSVEIADDSGKHCDGITLKVNVHADTVCTDIYHSYLYMQSCRRLEVEIVQG